MNKQHVTLTNGDRRKLEALLSKGTLPVKHFKRATALLELDRGKTLQAVAATLDVHYATVAAWRNGYRTRGLECLADAPRSGCPIVIDGTQRVKIHGLACSDAPEGYAHWSLRLLTEKVVESGICGHASRSFVGDVRKKNLKPHRKQTWCIGKIDAAFLARLEYILDVYAICSGSWFLVLSLLL